MQTSSTPNTDDPRLATIIKEGLEGHLTLIGFPYDIGAKRAGKPTGQEYGPDCLRRFLPKAGPTYNAEYDIDIRKLDITDYGNIDAEELTLENLQTKLISKVNRAVEKNAIPFVIGGSKDITYGCLKGLQSSPIGTNAKIGLISLQRFCDKDLLFEGDKIDQDCSVKMYMLEEKEESEDNKLKIMYFGSERYDNDNGTNKFKNIYKERLVFTHLEDIRKIGEVSLNQPLGDPVTQGGVVYKQKIEEFLQKCDVCHLSVSLEVLNTLYCPGVPKPQKNGLTCEEIIEIMFQSGKNKKLVSVSVSDYNPTVEDWRTGRLISNMFYYFALGYCSR